MAGSPESYFLEIADDPRIGGKARSLARLRAAGLPTPAGFVVGDALFRALLSGGADAAAPVAVDANTAGADAAAALARNPFPPGFSLELARRLAALGGPSFSVRSSFSGEDDPGALAAGVYESRTDVPAARLETALREVLRSAVSPAATAYAAARGRPAGQPPVGVLVHGYLGGDHAGGAAFDPARPERAPVVDVRSDPRGSGDLPGPIRARIEAAVRTLAARHGGVEIEWVAAGDEVTFLQLRPFRARAAAPPWSGLAELPGDGTTWRWDAAHNPLPLTPVQAGLLAQVDAAAPIGLRQRVAGGYLFWSEGPPAARAISPAELQPTLAKLETDVATSLSGLGDPPPLEATLAVFANHYETIYGLLRPAIQQARTNLTDFLRAHLPAALSSIPVLLAGVDSRASQRRRLAGSIARSTRADERTRAVADYLAVFGDESPVWDVAAPTYRECPDLLDALPGFGGAGAGAGAAGSAAPTPTPSPRAAGRGSGRGVRDWRAAADLVEAALPAALVPIWQERLRQARTAVAAGEDDDWIYARLQAALRRALLALGQRLHAAGSLDAAPDVFYLPLAALRAHAAGHPLTGRLRPLVQEGRARHETARRDPPPLAPRDDGSALPGSPLRGTGTGGRALGRVHHHDPSHPPAPDAVLVATTLLPTELPLYHPTALVTETGGPLGHVATQARERGLPAVVGAAGARDQLQEGELVLVDADAGLVIPIGPP